MTKIAGILSPSHIVILILLTTSSTFARRRSRADSPIENAADSPAEDNVATETEVIEARVKAPSFSAIAKDIRGFKCGKENISFELVTGFVLSSSESMIDTFPTLKLTECLAECRSNKTCYSLNYETGLCVLFSSNANELPGALTKSQFPVFTIYAQKTCVKNHHRQCNNRPWSIDRVQGYALKSSATKREVNATSRQECYESCFEEKEFVCRSASFYTATKKCELSDMDRITLGSLTSLRETEGSEYLENNCVDEPTKLCEFKKLNGKILKTVDSVHQDVESIEDCRELCLSSSFKCRSYDWNDTGDNICRLSHHNRVTLTDIQDAYLEVPEAATYELSSCYNVTIECKSADMVAKIKTSTLFDGKVYAKGSPNSCGIDVKNSLEFELKMGYEDLECNVRQSGFGRYLNDVVIQHHDMIVTSSDLGLALTCQYDLANKTVSNKEELDIDGDIETALNEEVVVDSPTVIMKITTRDGSSMKESAEVGDPLALKFEIMDESSPFEIFVRELVAMDGTDSAEIVLIDKRGCPTDHFIMGPIYRDDSSAKNLVSHFDAFKFPSSPTVQFRALITPCIPTCEPVQCDDESFGVEARSVASFGRKRRSANESYPSSTDDKSQTNALSSSMMLVQAIEINDKFGFEHKIPQGKSVEEFSKSSETFFFSPDDQITSLCVNGIGLLLAGAAFLLIQLVLIVIWSINGRTKSCSSMESPPTKMAIRMQQPNIDTKNYPIRDILTIQ